MIGRNDSIPLILIIRWVITTILFSSKKDVYVQTIMTLSSQTQYFLQLIIESVMNTLPQDDIDQSMMSEMCSMIEDSRLSMESLELSGLEQHVRPIAREEGNDSLVLEDSLSPRKGLDHQYENEIRELEIKVFNLQQNITTQKEETDYIRKQRDELQEEVYRLENEISVHKKVVMTMEGQERRRSLVTDEMNSRYENELKQLREEKDQLQRRVDLYVVENEQCMQELEFLRTNQTETAQRIKKAETDHAEDVRRLKEEVELLTSEKEYLEKQSSQLGVLKQRIEALKEVETSYEQLKRDVCGIWWNESFFKK